MIYKPKIKVPNPEFLQNMQSILKSNALTAVCEEAACPNRAECYARNSATFMILGDTCTRACTFCNVKTGHGKDVDINEPQRLAKAIKELQLKYVVITSVDRDDLKDYGSKHFTACVQAIKEQNPNTKIELLTPDFKYNTEALDTIISANAHKLAHNQETIRRLSKGVRPQSNYDRSLKVLEYYAKNSGLHVKSSLMLGLGETKEELLVTMKELLDVGVSELTLGQYLQPTPSHHKVQKYYPPEFFDEMKEEALGMGFRAVASGILVRSSYFAENLGE
ncbi:lipoyl synthase [Sulfurimonas autotrophica]|uniref:Lipoyl synthase n=1 Tax=Sulfurimonas autotrophica (strain ATCC BAA-671 / DSM 16294 / JCM 11897 / OK10) TaxID=563040 RepID=E0UP72_SULAO|nr:lipoyl synthase [Sulfurimonas autotrophica]ADN08536.1 lipoic acid synthetase [Sulfurimonas autotrophica DSM 16294]